MGFEAGNICCCSLEEQISKLFKLFRQRRHEIQFVFKWVSLKFESFAFSSSGIPSVIVPPNFGWTQVGLTSKLGLIFLQSRLQIAAKMSRSIETIKVHRAHIMSKLMADSTADLVRRVTNARVGG